jgi:hypothetical protein
VGDFALGVYVTLCVMLLVAMLGFGPRLLEWIEGIPHEPLTRPPRRDPRIAADRAPRLITSARR